MFALVKREGGRGFTIPFFFVIKPNKMIRKDGNGVYEIFKHGTWRIMDKEDILKAIGITHVYSHKDCCHKFYTEISTNNSNTSTETL